MHARIFEKYDDIIAVNENVKNILCEAYPQFTDKFSYIDNYIDADDIIYKSRQRIISKSLPTLCTCGRMAEVKGFDLAVKAGVELKKRGFSFKWLLVGDGPEREKIKKLISENNAQDFFEITGLKDNPYPYIAACDIYVQPSYSESYGLSIAEAQILWKPVITTATVGGKILVRDGENGIITDFSENEIADAAEKLLEDEELRKSFAEKLREISYFERKEKYVSDWKKLLGG